MVLSAEIMAISLASIVEPNLLVKAMVLAAVAFFVTAGVYGAVALIVKADDFGTWLRRAGLFDAAGRALVHGIPPFLKVLALVGTVAMLWVGGGILIHGLKEFGVTGPEHVLHAMAGAVKGAVPGIGGFLAWLATALIQPSWADRRRGNRGAVGPFRRAHYAYAQDAGVSQKL